MRIDTLKQAVTDAERFLAVSRSYLLAEETKAQPHHLNPRESGAVRRASMELTRKLADLRQGR